MAWVVSYVARNGRGAAAVAGSMSSLDGGGALAMPGNSTVDTATRPTTGAHKRLMDSVISFSPLASAGSADGARLHGGGDRDDLVVQLPGVDHRIVQLHHGAEGHLAHHRV